MAQSHIGVGAADNDHTGDTLRAALTKTEENFSQIFHGNEQWYGLSALRDVPTNSPTYDAAPAIRAAIADGEFVRLDGRKTYYLLSTDPADSGTLIRVQDRPLVMDFNGATVVSGLNKVTMTVRQTPTHDVTVSAVDTVTQVFDNAGTGIVTTVSRLTVSSTVGFVVGDAVKVASTDALPGMANYQMGEFAIVLEVDVVNNYIYVAHKLIEPFTTAIRLGRFRPNRIILANGTFDHIDAGLAGAWTATHLSVISCLDPILQNMKIARSWGTGISSNGNYGMRALNTKIWNCSPSNGVGYGFFDLCGFGTIAQLHGGFCRHLFTCNPRPVGNDDFFARRGRSWFHTITGTGYHCRNGNFDMHGDAYGCTFQGCSAIGGFRGAGGSVGSGFQIAGENSGMIGCRSDGSMNGVQVLNRNTDASPGVGVGLFIRDSTIFAEDRAIIAINSNTGDADNVAVLVENCKIRSGATASSDMVQITRADVTFKNCIFEAYGSGGTNGIRVVRVPGRGNVRFELGCSLVTTEALVTVSPVVLTTPGDSTAYGALLPRYEAGADRGNADVTLNISDARTQIFNAPLTTNRTVTLTHGGPAFRFVRTAASTGAFTLAIGSLTTLDPAEYAEISWNGTAWILTAKGSLA